MDFPSRTLVLHDGSGVAFGFLRLAQEPDSERWDCVFDIPLDAPEQESRSEVRWLYKRRYKRFGEHRLKVAEDGALTVSLAEFKFVLDPTEDGFASRRPAPPITAVWGAPAS